MAYTIHKLDQGSDAWKAHRAGCHNASELSAAMGSSSYKSRTDLIRQMASGIEQDIDAATQRRFDDGHRFEDLAIPLAEKIIGRELYPVTASIEVDGLARRLSASFDGMTDDDVPVNFEHKSLNVDLAAALDNDIIPEEYWPQMEQGMLINGASRTLFMASKWDENDRLIEEKHCWYESQQELRAKIVPTWRQIEEDAANYQHVEVIPEAVATPQEQMPAISVVVTGSVVVQDNLGEFKNALHKYIDGINRKPKTDDDFATVKAASQRLREVQTRIAAQKENLVGQVASVDTVLRAATELEELARVTAIELENLHEAETKNRKEAIVRAGQKAFADHIASLNARIGKPYMPACHADFQGAAKNKRTIKSLQNAIDTELARCKIDADQIAGRIELNLKTLREQAADYTFLFSDTSALVLKDTDAVAAIAAQRIAEHKSAEEKRLEAERAKIRADEEAKARREAEQKAQMAEHERLIAERAAQRIADEERNAAAAAAAAACITNESNTPPEGPAAVEPKDGTRETPALGQRETLSVVVDSGATIKLGDINALLAPISITQAGLEALGFAPVGNDKRAVLYRANDFTSICNAIATAVQRAANAFTLKMAA